MEQLWKLLAHGRARLVALASEVGGRWSEECRQFHCLLAEAKVGSEPKIMRSPSQTSVALPVGFSPCLLFRKCVSHVSPRAAWWGQMNGPTPSTVDEVWEARFSAP